MPPRNHQQVDIPSHAMQAAFVRDARMLANTSDDGPVRVDLEGVDRVRSCDLNDLIALHGQLRSAGRELVLVNVSTSVMEVFEFTRLTRLFRIELDRARQMVHTV